MAGTVKVLELRPPGPASVSVMARYGIDPHTNNPEGFRTGKVQFAQKGVQAFSIVDLGDGAGDHNPVGGRKALFAHGRMALWELSE